MKRIFIIALLIPAIAGAQTKGWSLRECIDYALEHNLTVKQNAITVEQRELDVNTAEGRRLPGVSAGASQNFSFGRGLTADNTYANTNTTSTSFSLGADVPIFNGGQINYGIKLSKLELAAATEDLDKVKNDIRVAVAQAYVQILYDKAILEVSDSQVQRDSMQLARIQAMLMNGKASSAEVASQQASLAQSRLSKVQAQNNLKLALLDLSQILELSSPEGFDVASPDANSLEPHVLMNPEVIYEEALGIRPEIKANELRLEYAEMNIARAKGAYLPSLNLSGGLGTNYYTSSGYQSKTFGEQVKNNFSQYIGLSLSIPIFSRFNTRNSVKSAELNFNTQQLQTENTKKSLYKEIQQVYYNAVAAQTKMLTSNEAAQSAELSMNLTTEKYENGKANITEYNEAKNRYLEAESNYLQARYECLYQTSLVNFYRGKEMEF